ncbi:DNA repair protein RAD16 [Phoenix dactylifera]|uniref:DNA repair protein RAD16 n=1 Tax=Phoenix dactylifera TaxID=42345 RepID=A0A8B9AFC6_PHODC|nr:DNA repair protein RAD16 [Phoenix dactylifera]
MPRRRRDPRNGGKRRMKAPDFSDHESFSTSDSDFVIDLDDEEFEDEEEAEPLPPPPPPAAAAVGEIGGVGSDRRRKGKSSSRKSRVRKDKGKSPLIWEMWEKDNEKWVDDSVAEEFDLERPLAETAEPSADIVLPLLRFQKEWLAWALKQEESEFRGGVLADEMGMGKTIQAISLVLTARSLSTRIVGGATSSDMGSCSISPLPRTKCTLVICPVVAVIQWVGEIERYTKKGTARVLVYHGAKRSNTDYDFNNYDFVLTTYSTIESDYRKHMMPPKLKCQYCDKSFYPHKMKVHLKYYCGPYAQKTEKQSKQVSKKKKYSSVDDEKGKGKKKGGHNREKQEEFLSSSEDEKGKRKNKRDSKTRKQEKPSENTLGSSEGKSVLHSWKWQRIILDEAHFIKDRRCNTAKAVFALESLYKWALSGTPLQNRVGELYSLVRFLQIHPYSYYFCRDCNCKILDYRSSTCTECPHSSTRHFCWWNKNITKPIQNLSTFDEGRRAMILLRDRVLKNIVLRRTKKGRAADLALPPRLVTLRRDTLDRNEQEFYEALYTQSCVQFDTYVSAGTLMNNYAHIFDLLTRLRQAVDHPYLVIYSKTTEMPDGSKDDTVKDNCGICHDPAEDLVVTSCEHVFCKACLIDYSSALGNVSCPTCSKPLTVDLTTKNSAEKLSRTAIKGYKHSGILNRLNDIGDFKSSTKIDALMEEIRDMVENDGSAKGIVFSQFTSFLDLIGFSLQRSGIKCVQLVGSMSIPEREKAIKSFTDDVDCKIFLMSLKAGGVALNLTVASYVFLMDPWWNPAVERQAQDRIHRIGQYKPIRTVRFVIEDTIEERILKLQEKKELVFEGTIGNSSAAMGKLTEADLRLLFHI